MLVLAGRLLIATLFVVSGIWHAAHFSITVAYFTRIGLPLPLVTSVLAILVEIGGGILLATGWRARWLAFLMAGYVLAATAFGHRFWEEDPSRFFGEMNNFLKNLAIIGGLLIFAARGKA